MTAVVFDRRKKVLFADEQWTSSAGNRWLMEKIREPWDRVYFAASGSLASAEDVYNHLTTAEFPLANPVPKDEEGGEDGGCDCLLYFVEQDRLYVYSSGDRRWHLVGNDLINLGSGGGVAIGAWLAGKRPAECVEIASRMDAFTGGGAHVKRWR